MQRRDWIKTALGGTGAIIATRDAGALTTDLAPMAAAAAAAVENESWTPLLFDVHQNETVITLTELVIPETDTPGAKAAHVNRYIDLMLHDVVPEKSPEFLKGLGWLDGHAIEQHAAPFIQLEESQQVAILESINDQAVGDLSMGSEFFAALKRLTIEGYYTSKVGIDELNKSGIPETFACQHDSHE